MSSSPPTPQDNPMPVRSLRGQATSRSLPESPDLSTARGKGGCWYVVSLHHHHLPQVSHPTSPRIPPPPTCRLRRKKCDEARENGSCHTCIRLKIDCLGWGARRPEWMRDKVQVEAYKAGIKRQLSSQGMIRGQPRPHTVSSSSNVSPVQYQYPITRVQQDTGSDETDEYSYDQSGSANTSPSYPPIQMPQLTPDLSSGISALDLHLYPPSGPHTPPVLPSSFATSSPHVIEGDISTIMPFVPSQSYYEPPHSLSTPPSGPESREHNVLYYFRRVRQMQFVFAGPSVTSIFHDLVIREPVGVVTNAICALAALHKSQTRVAEGLEDPNAENSLCVLSKQYYDQAWWQLLDSRRRHHRYMEQDATAAVHLVSYLLFCGGGGGGEWQPPLSVACDWLAESPLASVSNPRLQWLQLNPSARFTAQMTMWLDIISAIGVRRIPRFMDLYHRLFRTDAQNYWPGSPQTPHVPNLHMDALTGCPDGVMYALAQTAALAHWKMQQQQAYSLSVRELVRRSEVIEQDLRASWITASPEVFPHLLEQHYDGAPAGTGVGSAHTSPIHGTADLVAAGVPLSTPEPTIGAETRRLVANVFFEAAVLHLQSVVNDHNPVVPEIMDGVNATMQALNKLALSEVDRGLVFPICVAGCLADLPEQREFFKQRLDTQASTLGNLGQTRRLMEMVWRTRDNQGGVVDWRNTMSEIGISLLVI